MLGFDRFCAAALADALFFILDFEQAVNHLPLVFLKVGRLCVDPWITFCGAHRFLSPHEAALVSAESCILSSLVCFDLRVEWAVASKSRTFVVPTLCGAAWGGRGAVVVEAPAFMRGKGTSALRRKAWMVIVRFGAGIFPLTKDQLPLFATELVKIAWLHALNAQPSRFLLREDAYALQCKHGG